MPRLLTLEFGDNNVPVLDVKPETVDGLMARSADQADPEHEAELLTGASVVLGNPRPLNDPTVPGRTIYRIGSSTIDEAVKEIVASFGEHALDMPSYVASTDEHLAEAVAEHFTLKGYHNCPVISLDKAV
jgi:hypothetical protein